MKLKKILSIVYAFYLTIFLSLPSLAIKEVNSVKQVKEGVIPGLAKEEMIKRLQDHMSSVQESKIDKESLKMATSFSAFPDEARIDLVLRDVEVASILKIIAKEGAMNIIIDESVMGFISAELKNISLNEAMEIILVSEELEARITNSTIFIASRPAMAKKGLNRNVIKTFKLNNSNAVEISDILRASIFNKGYKVNEEAATGSSLPAIAVDPEAVVEEQTTDAKTGGSSTGQSNLIDAKTIKGKVETLEAGSGFGSAGELASSIKIQHNTAKTGNITVDNNDGGAIVIPDTRTNSILVAGLKEDIALAEEAIKYLDKKLRQVSIEVSLIELSKDDSKDLGVSTAMQGGKSVGGFNAPSGSFLEDYNYTSSANQFGLVVDSMSNSIGDDLAFKLNAKLYNEEAKLLANPNILALDGSESLIKITEQVVNKIQTTVTQTSITYSAELADVGIVLNLLPKIGDDDYITMRIRPSITSSLPSIAVGQPGGSYVEVTPISTREVILQDVRVKSGETLAIAGLTKEKTVEKVGKLPIIGQIPILGRLFSNTEYDREKKELIILIKPTIVDDVASL